MPGTVSLGLLGDVTICATTQNYPFQAKIPDRNQTCTYQTTSTSDGRVVRASASGAVDSGVIPSRVKPMTLKLLFINS